MVAYGLPGPTWYVAASAARGTSMDATKARTRRSRRDMAFEDTQKPRGRGADSLTHPERTGLRERRARAAKKARIRVGIAVAVRSGVRPRRCKPRRRS